MAAESLPTDPSSLASFGKKKGLDPVRLAIGLLVVSAVLTLAGYFFLSHYHASNPENAVSRLARSSSPYARSFVAESLQYRSWLIRRGTAREVALFDGMSEILAIVGIESGAFDDADSVTVGFLSASMSCLTRLMFIIVMCWRLWVIAIVFAAVWAIIAFQPYRGEDFMGQASIGRHFYSGIYAGLNNLTSRGEIDTLLPGLACPKFVDIKTLEASALLELITRFDARNATNDRLISYILAYPDCPAYVAIPEDEEKLKTYMRVPSLIEATELICEELLTLHQQFAGGKTSIPGGKKPVVVAPADPMSNLPLVQDDSKGISAQQFSHRVKECCDRVLDEFSKEDLARIHPAELATMLLSVFAGKVLAYVKSGAIWMPKSTMPQLSSRAVLHSVVAFPKDYNYVQRMRIRRALIFASRKSAFGPVNLPLDLTKRTQAARQWMEVLFANPFEIEARADEVELFGLSWRLQRQWRQRYFEWVAGLREGTVEHNTFATDAGMIFMPVQLLVEQWRSVSDTKFSKRINELALAVHTRQVNLELHRGDAEEVLIPMYERILAPLSKEEIELLAELHEVPANIIRDWSAMRVVLNSYSWLGRRVGHMTIPNSSIVFGVFHVDISLPGKNHLGLVGRKGLVPLRSSRLQDKWGKVWRTRFIAGETDSVASTLDEYRALLEGRRIDDFDAHALEGSSAVV